MTGLDKDRDYHRERLNRFVVRILLAPQEDDLHKILPIIRQKLTMFNLLGYYDEMEVFQTAYQRAIKKINESEDFNIEYLPGWFVRTSWNIVRELAREKRAEIKKINKIINSFKSDFEDKYVTQMNNSQEKENIISNLRKALNRITESDREIIEMRYFQGLKYEEILRLCHQHEGDRDEIKKKTANLRKRCSRAVKRLGGIYEEIAEESKME